MGTNKKANVIQLLIGFAMAYGCCLLGIGGYVVIELRDKPAEMWPALGFILFITLALLAGILLALRDLSHPENRPHDDESDDK